MLFPVSLLLFVAPHEIINNRIKRASQVDIGLLDLELCVCGPPIRINRPALAASTAVTSALLAPSLQLFPVVSGCVASTGLSTTTNHAFG